MVSHTHTHVTWGASRLARDTPRPSRGCRTLTARRCSKSWTPRPPLVPPPPRRCSRPRSCLVSATSALFLWDKKCDYYLDPALAPWLTPTLDPTGATRWPRYLPSANEVYEGYVDTCVCPQGGGLCQQWHPNRPMLHLWTDPTPGQWHPDCMLTSGRWPTPTAVHSCFVLRKSRGSVGLFCTFQWNPQPHQVFCDIWRDVRNHLVLGQRWYQLILSHNFSVPLMVVFRELERDREYKHTVYHAEL